MIDSHYIYRPPVLDAATFTEFAADVRKLMKALPSDISIRGEDGTGVPIISPTVIVFNGDAAEGAEHEPLIIQQTYSLRPPDRMRNGVYFDFCKTNGKPYDLLVVAVLYAFTHHFPQVKFTSDSTLDELKAGFDLFFETCDPTDDVQRLYRRPVDEKETA